jgi:hypothetical protein
MSNNKPIEEWLNEQPSNTSPSDSATLLGLDNGETVKIPISKFPVIETDELIPDRKMLNGEYEFTDILLARGGIIVENGAGISLHYQADRGNNTIDLFCNEDSKIQCLSMDNDFNYKTEILATEKYVDEKISSLPSGGGSSSGGGASIIYATELPSTPAQAIYVVTQDEVVRAEIIMQDGSTLTPEYAYIEIVDELPNDAHIFMYDSGVYAQAMYGYYLTTDDRVYGYIDEALNTAMGLPVGWNDLGTIGLVKIVHSTDEYDSNYQVNTLVTTEPKTRVYVPMQDGTFLELTSGIRTRFDEHSRVVSITEM